MAIRIFVGLRYYPTVDDDDDNDDDDDVAGGHVGSIFKSNHLAHIKYQESNKTD